MCIVMKPPNAFWARFGGKISPGYECAACKTANCGGGTYRIQGYRMGAGRRENKGGVGKRYRRRKAYANPKLRRLSLLG